MSLRIAFMGTPDFAVPILEALAASPHQLVCIYCQPPRPAGRGHRDQPSPVQRRAAELGIEQRYPVSLKDPGIQAEFRALDLDLAVVAAYGLILPQAILDAPRLGCLNVHASLLPRWRGAAPIHRAILAGDDETGITIMQMDAGLDTGAIMLQESLPITPQTTSSSLHDELAALGARLILDAVAGVAAGTLHAHPQPEDGITYAAKLRREEASLDWRLPAAQLERTIRALNPWPGTSFDYQGERIKISAAEIAPLPAPAAPGTITDEQFGIACGDGFLLRPLRLQRPGRQALDRDAFLRGCPAVPGLVLSSSS